ncbi:hypothetical protein EOPP23_06985 [Endozoicomonas sp. OPT23]|uniref:protein kinase domain-containing protein n=1 Tax=Endozoicomonas sp. OPT23 TaxID=2072845 RepID=UPI00129B4A3E|nr:protein kinase [Endozoicomonas sp. OPT23]MRI32731.1 hypothetical protein [Endozoicomonas sp. OPT23]
MARKDSIGSNESVNNPGIYPVAEDASNFAGKSSDEGKFNHRSVKPESSISERGSPDALPPEKYQAMLERRSVEEHREYELYLSRSRVTESLPKYRGQVLPSPKLGDLESGSEEAIGAGNNAVVFPAKRKQVLSEAKQEPEPASSESAAEDRSFFQQLKGAVGELVDQIWKEKEVEPEWDPLTLDKTYVVKKRKLAEGHENKSLAEREFKHGIALKESNLQNQDPGNVKVVDLGMDLDDQEFPIVMTDGGYSVRGFLVTDEAGVFQPLPQAMAHNITRQLFSHVASFHEQNILHNDLKPDNLLINHAGELSVIDFGSSSDLNQELTSLIGGAPYYNSPEFMIAETNKSLKKDVWACGIMMMEMYTGIRPGIWMNYDETNRKWSFNPDGHKRCMSLVRKKLKEDGVPELSEVLEKMLNPDPEKRCTMAEASQLFQKLRGDNLSFGELQTLHAEALSELAKAEKAYERPDSLGHWDELKQELYRAQKKVTDLDKRLSLHQLKSEHRTLMKGIEKERQKWYEGETPDEEELLYMNLRLRQMNLAAAELESRIKLFKG